MHGCIYLRCLRALFLLLCSVLGPGGKKVKEDMTALCFRTDCVKHNPYILTWSISYTEAGWSRQVGSGLRDYNFARNKTKQIPWAGERAVLVKRLPCILEDLSLIPEPHAPGELGDWDSWDPGAHWPTSPTSLVKVRTNESPCLKQHVERFLVLDSTLSACTCRWTWTCIMPLHTQKIKHNLIVLLWTLNLNNNSKRREFT